MTVHQLAPQREGEGAMTLSSQAAFGPAFFPSWALFLDKFLNLTELHFPYLQSAGENIHIVGLWGLGEMTYAEVLCM